jgi:4-amino-4-deoxy-L-arabinose transferase-like glycosyltransferase
MTGFFSQNKIWQRLAVLALLLVGLAVRWMDLTDPPLDIHPTRQLHSALMARGMYYATVTDAPAWQVELAIEQGKREAVIEPPVMETLTAWLYRLAGGEKVWLARLLSSFFWVIAGLAVFGLAARMTGTAGGLTALGFYLLQTYGVLASRTFQPDPLMVALIAAALWAFYAWLESPGWRRAAAAGLFCGTAIFIKNVSVFFLAVPIIFLLARKDIKNLLRNGQVWLIGVLSMLPFGIYTLYGTFVAKFLGQQFSFRFFPNLWLEAANYSRWIDKINSTVGIPALILGLVGVLLLPAGKPRKLAIGLWLGYLIYGMTFAYHIGTHDYYQLPLVLIIALSLAPLGSLIGKAFNEMAGGMKSRLAQAAVLLVVVGLAVWPARNALRGEDYRTEPAFWRTLGDRLRDEPVVGLTQDYGYRMAFYGWDSITNWPGSGDLAVRQLAGRVTPEFEEMFQNFSEGKSYFLVTWFDDYQRQQSLRAYLETHYPVESGAGYLLFDLQHPLNP